MPVFGIKHAEAAGSGAAEIAQLIVQLSKNAADLLGCAPASAAASAVLKILDIVQKVRANKEKCLRIALRAARFWVSLRDKMADCWGSASITLIADVTRLQGVFISISVAMQSAANERWLDRFLCKAGVERDLDDVSEELETTIRSFDLTSLIELRYISAQIYERVNHITNEDSTNFPRSSALVIRPEMPVAAPSPSSPDDTLVGSSSYMTTDTGSRSSKLEVSENTSGRKEGNFLTSSTEIELKEFLSPSDSFPLGEKGFRTYHQSDVEFVGRRRPVGWFSETYNAVLGGRSLIAKIYEEIEDTEALNTLKWMKDIKLLTRVCHPNLPQLFGYSDFRTPTRFILMSGVSPSSDLRSRYSKELDGFYTDMFSVMQVYSDASSAARHVQRQLRFSDETMEWFIRNATYTVDENNKFLLGLPNDLAPNDLPGEHFCESYMRNLLFFAAYSNPFYQLPEKHEHIATSYPTLINQRTLTIDPRVSFLFDQHLTGSLQDFQDLAQLYTSNNTWEQIIADHYGSVTDLKAGDVLIWSGRGLGAWRSLRSVFEVADKEVAQALATSTESVVYQWTKKEGWFTGQPVLLPDGHQAWLLDLRLGNHVHVSQWNRVVSIQKARQYLVDNARFFAEQASVNPEELIMVTRTLINKSYMVNPVSEDVTSKTGSPYLVIPPGDTQTPYIADSLSDIAGDQSIAIPPVSQQWKAKLDEYFCEPPYYIQVTREDIAD